MPNLIVPVRGLVIPSIITGRTSILPPWKDQWLQSGVTPVTATSASDLRDKYEAIADTGTIILQGGINYGDFNINRANHRVRLLGATSIFSAPTPNTDPFYDLNLRKTGNTDTMPAGYSGNSKSRIADYFCKGTETALGQRVRINITINTNVGDVMLENLHLTQRFQPNPSWARRLWMRRCYGADFEGQVWSTTGNSYSSARLECVLQECWIWADGSKNPTDGTTNYFSDYGNITHQVNTLYYEDCLFEGGYNHMISLKADSGRANGVFINRTIFAPWGSSQRRATYVQAQFGQNADDYQTTSGSGGVGGDNTVGYVNLTKNTFMDYANPAGTWMAWRLQNCMGVTADGNEIWPNLIAFQLRAGDFDGSTSQFQGATAWSQKSYVKNNSFRRAHSITTSHGSTNGVAGRGVGQAGGYKDPTEIEFENNSLPNGGFMSFSNSINAIATRINGDASGFRIT